jgi:prolyl 4-hydroxylase
MAFDKNVSIWGGFQSIVLRFVVLVLVFQTVHSELFTALVDLEKVLYTEQKVASDLRRYISQEEARLEQLKKLANDYEAHSNEALSNPERHLANPVNAFLLVKRFTTDWQSMIERYVISNASAEFLDSMKIYSVNLPRDEDLKGAAAALLRLQDVYALPTEHIAMGNIQGVQNSPILTAEECFELGRHAYVTKDYYHALLWMQEAYSHLQHENPPTVELADVLDYLAYSTAMQGNIQHALNLTIDWLKIEPNHQRALNNKQYFEGVLKNKEIEKKKGDDGTDDDKIKNERQLDEYRRSPEFMSYEALCRGEKVKEVANEHKLTC